VRKIVGHDRLESMLAYQQLGELYQAARLLVNAFQPSMKLQSKHIEGEHERRIYNDLAPVLGLMRISHAQQKGCFLPPGSSLIQPHEKSTSAFASLELSFLLSTRRIDESPFLRPIRVLSGNVFVDRPIQRSQEGRPIRAPIPCSVRSRGETLRDREHPMDNHIHWGMEMESSEHSTRVGRASPSRWQACRDVFGRKR
jgi:hypothetical protein